MQEDLQSEFSRQAAHMNTAPAFHAELGRLVDAVGEAPSDRVLDVACGPGIVAEALAPHVREVVGVDATQEMIRLARQRFEKTDLGNGSFQVGSAEQLPYGDGEFDQAVARLALHHFSDPALVLREVRRVLRPGGRLILADVVSSEAAEESALHNSLEILRDPTHVRMLPPTELIALVRSSGFSVVREESWQQQRSFTEWAAIIADRARMQPLETVMRALARAGQAAGIDLREDGDALLFMHSWLMVVAKSD